MAHRHQSRSGLGPIVRADVNPERSPGLVVIVVAVDQADAEDHRGQQGAHPGQQLQRSCREPCQGERATGEGQQQQTDQQTAAGTEQTRASRADTAQSQGRHHHNQPPSPKQPPRRRTRGTGTPGPAVQQGHGEATWQPGSSVPRQADRSAHPGPAPANALPSRPSFTQRHGPKRRVCPTPGIMREASPEGAFVFARDKDQQWVYLAEPGPSKASG